MTFSESRPTCAHLDISHSRIVLQPLDGFSQESGANAKDAPQQTPNEGNSLRFGNGTSPAGTCRYNQRSLHSHITQARSRTERVPSLPSWQQTRSKNWLEGSLQGPHNGCNTLPCRVRTEELSWRGFGWPAGGPCCWESPSWDGNAIRSFVRSFVRKLQSWILLWLTPSCEISRKRERETRERVKPEKKRKKDGGKVAVLWET